MSGLDLLLSQQTYVIMLAAAFLTGIAMGIVYDLWRILRMAVGDPDAWPDHPDGRSPSSHRGDSSPRLGRRIAVGAVRTVGDLLFAVTSAVAWILLCYYTNDGQLRAPAIIGMACGFFAYIQTVSRLVLALAAVGLRLCRRFLVALAHLGIRVGKLLFCGLVLRPASFVARLLAALWRVTAGRLTEQRRARMTEKRLNTLKEQASQGFFGDPPPPFE